jgi:hypothetical protein
MTLRDGTRETAFLSVYSIAYSASLGGGHVALLEIDHGAQRIVATLAETAELGRLMQERLRGMGFERSSIRTPVVAATFVHEPWGPSGFGFRVRTEELEISARWEEVSAPEWVDGSDGGLSRDEDIWALMVEARRGRIVVNGLEAPGQPFADEAWLPKLGRSLSSAHTAFAEVRLTPGADVNDRARGSEPGG